MTMATLKDWDEPDPLPAQGRRPTFPIETLGTTCSAFVSAVAEDTGTPVCLAGTAVLGVCSTILGGSLVVEANAGWREPVNLYIAGVVASGEGKSPALARCRRVLDIIEEERREKALPEIAVQQALKGAAEARERDATHRAAKAKDTPSRLQAEQEMREAVDENQGLVVSKPPRLYTSEATPEGIVRLLGEQGGRLGVVSDEGGEFFELASRYSTAGKVNLGIYLQGYDGQRYVSDRATRDPIVIDRATLTVYLLAQPVVLEGLARDRQANGRGLLARFLWTCPQSLVGSRTVRRPPVDPAIADRFDELVIDLASEAQGVSDAPTLLRLDPDAQDIFWQWSESHEPRLHPAAGDLAGIVEWASKQPGRVLRLAGNLHALQAGTIHGVVSGATMEAAIGLADYFTAHAQLIFGEMGADPAVADAEKVLDWIRRKAFDEFTTRGLYRSKGWEPKRTNPLSPRWSSMDGCDRSRRRRVPADRRTAGAPTRIYSTKPDKTVGRTRICQVLSGIFPISSWPIKETVRSHQMRKDPLLHFPPTRVIPSLKRTKKGKRTSPRTWTP